MNEVSREPTYWVSDAPLKEFSRLAQRFDQDCFIYQGEETDRLRLRLEMEAHDQLATEGWTLFVPPVGLH